MVNPVQSTSSPTPPITTATVIGAGTMGAAIAAHLVNAGLRVFLLDIADQSDPPSAAEDAKPAGATIPAAATIPAGATIPAAAERARRNRIVEAGFARMCAARPANLFAPELAERITLGNLEDDLAQAARASDWIIEAIVERLEPKQALMARIEAVAPPHAIVSTNTSGLPIHAIVQACSPAFRRRFLGAHFFNPPRYLYLLELIPTAETDPAVLAHLREFAGRTLGKGVVVCKDTPNFIANRMISYIISRLMEFAVVQGYTVEEVDYLAGPLIGRPRSGLFRLLDVIGIDVMAQINRNLYDLIPHDPDREALRAPRHTAVLQTLLDHGHLGVKSGQGFYKTVVDDTGARAFWTLDLQAAAQGEVRYNPPAEPDFPAVAGVRRAPLAQRLLALTQDTGRAGALVWHTLAHSLVYAARRIPEMADSLVDIDRVMRWGFLWELGPFEIWDALGVAPTAQRMSDENLEPPAWVQTLLAQGHSSFYTSHGDETLAYEPVRQTFAGQPDQIVQWDLPNVRRARAPLYTNQSATLHLVPPQSDAAGHLLLLEFHSKLNALDAASLDALEAARDALNGSLPQGAALAAGDAIGGLLIANRGPHFCVGANLQLMLDAAQAQAWDTLESFIRRGQYLFLDLRRGAQPVVAAPFQRVLGGGVEVCLAAHRVVAQAETYIGLVEVSVGLIPGWGGCKELVRRHVTPNGAGDGLPLGLQQVFETIVFAKVSSSAHHAKTLGLLDAQDEIVMNPELLLETARDRAFALVASLPGATAPAQLFAAGRAGLDRLHAQIDAHHEQGKLSEHDRLIGHKLAHVLCGAGDSGWQTEEDFLERERAAFVSLAGESKTQARMAHMLRTGKPLKN